MRSVWRTDIGRARNSNQDSLLLLAGPYPLYAIADGMGGHLGGDIASAMAVNSLKDSVKGIKPSQEEIRRCFSSISRDIFQRQMQDKALAGMGTTLTMLWEDEREVFLGHVGDSRAYLLRAGELSQLSLDHSLVTELLRSGAIDAAAAESYPYRNVITRAVGAEEEIVCDTAVFDKLPGDRFLLCSDGLSEYIKAKPLAALLGQEDMEHIADTLLFTALDLGGRDNITFIIMEVEA